MLLPLVLAAAALQSPDAPKMATTPAAASTAAPAPSGHVEAGLAAYKRGRMAQAQAEFEKAVEAEPGAAAYYNLGYVTYKRVEHQRPFHPDKQKAAQLFAKAYELDPAFRPVWAGPPPAPASK